MRKIILTIVMGFSFFGLFGQTNNFKSVEVEEFAKIIKGSKVTVLDVRLPQEYDEGYIPGTDFNIDVLEANFTEVALEKIPKDKPVALYCRSGNRSKTAARILSEKGYEVIELGKGFRAWEAAGKKIAYPKKK
jgi:rhodanese-related sulfurtransferase